MVECSISSESCGFECTGSDESETWKKIHDLPSKMNCETCANHADSLFKGVHDTVNLGLGKKPFDSQNFSKFAKEVQCAFDRCKKDGNC